MADDPLTTSPDSGMDISGDSVNSKEAASNGQALVHSRPCEMCQNYETNLTIMQEAERKLNKEMKMLQSKCERYESDLIKEREYRIEMEKKMVEMAAQTEDQIKDAVRMNGVLEKRFDEISEEHREARKSLTARLEEMKTVTENLESDLEDVTNKYKQLLGLNRTTAAEMQAEPIDLPADVEQLQLLCLQMREELIETKAGRLQKERELADDVALLREQLTEERSGREALERDLLGQVNELQTELGIARSKLVSASTAVASSEENTRQIRDLQNTVAELEAQVAQVQNERSAVEITAQNYKARCSSLQNELNTTEAVQKDFVQLSQSLQIQLEKIRQSEQEVRFQWEDDVENCTGCNTSVAKLKPRPRCRHCGKIFCVPCVKLTVPSGPNRRPATVCQVCHTLLNRDSKPFFAQDPPK